MPTKFDLSKFNSSARKVLERAQNLAGRLNHQHVECEHVLVAILEEDTNPGTRALKDVGVETKSLGRKLIDELELLPKSYRKADQVYVGKRLLAVLQAAQEKGGDNASPVDVLVAMAEESSGFAPRQLREMGATADKLAGKKGKTSSKKGPAGGKSGAPDVPEMLGKFATDLTQLALDGELGRIIGRDDEIRRMIQILSRRGKNNPVLIGQPGVGKSAIVEALAIRMAHDDVPLGLKGRRIMSLDLGSLVAGTSLRGQFEERLKTIVNEIIESDGRIILYIDELHQMVGAGGGDGPMNASNLLKPALARGQISIIGTTTIDEYREYIEADAGLERRFQTILVEEPSVDQCVSILRGIKQRYEIHHGVQINDSALVAASKMTDRYITDRALPDKAIDAIDEAASRLRLEIDSKPTELDEVERRISNIEVELQALADETNPDSVEAREKLQKEVEKLFEERDALNERWEIEKGALGGVTEKK
jgi:ATP-dependent Clp protease ATP-binding subunit ClpB